MKRIFVLAFFLALATAPAEVHTLTLRQAVDRALTQNPDLIIARLDEQQAAQQVNVARDPFMPRVYVGSGLAYTHGFPMTVEGQAPALVQVTGVASLINRPQRHRLSQAKEEARGAVLDSESARDRIAIRAVELYLEAENAAKVAKMVREQIDGLERVAATVRARVEEGRELEVEHKRATLDVARALHRARSAEADREYAEQRLAAVLGFAPGDRVAAAREERTAPELLESEERVVAAVLEDNVAVRQIESSLVAKGFALKAEKSERLPRMNLLAKYGLFAKFNNYEEYFTRFQRNNAQIGVSLELPVFMGPGYKATIVQAQMDIERLRIELDSTRGTIVLNAKRQYQELKQAETATDIARMELEVVRADLDVVLAKVDEGRATVRDLEAARYIENERWIAFYDAHHALELARFRLLERTGGLLAALR